MIKYKRQKTTNNINESLPQGGEEMRIKLFFELENNTISQQYRKGIISWIKNAIEKYDENLFHEIYKDNRKKTFSWAAILSRPTFHKEEIIMQDNQLSVVFSAFNYSHALHLYNSFLNQKFKKYPLNKNSMTLMNISMIPEREIIADEITIKMSSPLIVRNHNRETRKDMYYAYNKEGFQKYIRINIEEQLQAENLDSSLLEGFEIQELQAKKIVIPVYEKMIECSVGMFQLKGNMELLDYLYKAGIGTKKAMGFGLFELVK